MKRIDLFEFTDLSWYPQVFRRIQTDYLQFAASMGAGHQNLLPLLMKAMQHAHTLVRFFWTYLIPIVPLATCWDGIVSLLRVYSPQELNELTTQIHCDEYIWEIGQASTGTPLFVFTYLIGYPTQTLT